MKKDFKKLLIIAVISIIIFIGLLFIEKNVLNPNGVSSVFIAKNEIKANTVITMENIDELFILKNNIDNTTKVENSISSKEELINKTIMYPLEKNEQITLGKIEENTHLKGLKNPVEVSIRVSDISQIVGGILRSGDIINISAINNTTHESELILENIYVDKAFTTDGARINITDSTSAITINVIIDSIEETKLNSALAVGNIRISKIK